MAKFTFDDMIKGVPEPLIPSGIQNPTFIFIKQLIEWCKGIFGLLSSTNIIKVIVDSGVGLPSGDGPAVLIKKTDGSIQWLTVPDVTKDYGLAFDSSTPTTPKWVEVTDECP